MDDKKDKLEYLNKQIDKHLHNIDVYAYRNNDETNYEIWWSSSLLKHYRAERSKLMGMIDDD